MKEAIWHVFYYLIGEPKKAKSFQEKNNNETSRKELIYGKESIINKELAFNNGIIISNICGWM
jgi:hypothetical protein